MKRDRFLAQFTTAGPATAQIASLRAFLAEILALCSERWIDGDRLPDYLRFDVVASRSRCSGPISTKAGDQPLAGSAGGMG